MSDTSQRLLRRQPGSADTDWRNRAACREVDPDLFFPVGVSGPALLQIEEAKRVCRACPVHSPCLRWAVESGENTGVWGGTTEDERRMLRVARAAGLAAYGTRQLQFKQFQHRRQFQDRHETSLLFPKQLAYIFPVFLRLVINGHHGAPFVESHRGPGSPQGPRWEASTAGPSQWARSRLGWRHARAVYTHPRAVAWPRLHRRRPVALPASRNAASSASHGPEWPLAAMTDSRLARNHWCVTGTPAEAGRRRSTRDNRRGYSARWSRYIHEPDSIANGPCDDDCERRPVPPDHTG